MKRHEISRDSLGHVEVGLPSLRLLEGPLSSKQKTASFTYRYNLEVIRLGRAIHSWT
jgi:hypothetical protein